MRSFFILLAFLVVSGCASINAREFIGVWEGYLNDRGTNSYEAIVKIYEDGTLMMSTKGLDDKAGLWRVDDNDSFLIFFKTKSDWRAVSNSGLLELSTTDDLNNVTLKRKNISNEKYIGFWNGEMPTKSCVNCKVSGSAPIELEIDKNGLIYFRFEKYEQRKAWAIDKSNALIVYSDYRGQGLIIDGVPTLTAKSGKPLNLIKK